MRRRLLKHDEENDPMSVVSNLFDVAMVFAVALMVALVSRYNMTEVFSQEDFTVVKNPGRAATRPRRIRIRSRANAAARSAWPTNSKTARSSTFRNSGALPALQTKSHFGTYVRKGFFP